MVLEDGVEKPSNSRALSVVSTSAPSSSWMSVSWTTPPSRKAVMEGCSLFTIQVLTQGHSAFCIHVTMVEGFSCPSMKMRQSWTCMKESIQGMVDLEEELQTIGEDTILKEKAINYVSVYISLNLILISVCCSPRFGELPPKLEGSWWQRLSRKFLPAMAFLEQWSPRTLLQSFNDSSSPGHSLMVSLISK